VQLRLLVGLGAAAVGVAVIAVGLASRGIGARPPTWRIAYSTDSRRSGNLEIHVIGADGTGDRALTRHGPTGFVRGWVARGRSLVISGDDNHLWVVEADGSQASRVASTDDAQVSPSGGAVASFAANGNIVIRTPRGRLLRLIRTHLGPADSLDELAFPVWSPDERRLAYYVVRDTGAGESSRIYVVNVDGSDRRLLSKGRSPQDLTPEWSPDGGKIAFAAYPADPLSAAVHDEDLYVMNSDGSGRRRLARHMAQDSGVEVIGGLQWSPRGGAVAYRGASGGAYVAGLDGGPPRKLAATGRHASPPEWDASGRWLAFADADQLVVVGADGRGARIVVRQTALGEVVWGTGRQIAFDAEGGVFGVDSSGEHLRTLVGARVSDTSPQWSPDGSRIAFVRTGDGAGVYLMNADGSKLARITKGDAVGWAPDGRRLVVGGPLARSDLGLQQGPIVVVDLVNGKRHTVGFGQQPVWAPVGQMIAYVRHKVRRGQEFGSRLLVVNGNGTGERTLAERTFFPASPFYESYYWPAWKPDGSEVALDVALLETDPAYQEAERLGVVDLAGKSWTLKPLGGSWLAWSPRGDEVAYVDTELANGIGAATADGASMRAIVPVAGRHEYRDLEWSPDAQRLAFSRCSDAGDERTCAIYLVGHDGRGRRRLVSGAAPSWQPR
jgi:TolB protein